MKNIRFLLFIGKISRHLAFYIISELSIDRPIIISFSIDITIKYALKISVSQ